MLALTLSWLLSSSVCFAEMLLHHVVALDAVLADIYAVVAPGGFLIIREHDAFEEDFGVVVDVQHGSFCLVFDETPQWSGFCDVGSTALLCWSRVFVPKGGR